MSKSTTRKKNKIPVFHPMNVKLQTVKSINISLRSGAKRSKTINQLAKKLRVHRTTIESWMLQWGHLASTKAVTKTKLYNDPTPVTTKRTPIVNNCTVKLDNGAYAKLTANDINRISEIKPLMLLTAPDNG